MPKTLKAGHIFILLHLVSEPSLGVWIQESRRGIFLSLWSIIKIRVIGANIHKAVDARLPQHTGLISSDSIQITTLTAFITLKIQPFLL